EPLRGWQVVGVAGGDGFPGVAGRVGVGDAEGAQESLLTVGAVVGQALAGPLAGDQDAAPGVAEGFAAGCVGPAAGGPQARPGVLGLDAVAEPVGAPRRARLVAQGLGELVGVRVLGVGLRLVAAAEMLSEVLGQVADAPVGVAGPGKHALGVELVPE